MLQYPVKEGSAGEMALRKGTETVLVVDDEALIAELVQDSLARHGYIVLTAASGEEALSLYQQHAGTIAAVILDIRMPNLDGFETFRRLRAIDAGARIIISSGYDHERDKGRLLKEGVSAFLDKPYRLDELIRTVGTVIEGTSDKRRK
jgi:DNA-binding response OmpR family regulator